MGASREAVVTKTSNILGISAYYHDSAAALLKDGELVAAAQQERFTRKKHDAGFPSDAIRYCLEAENVRLGDVDRVVFYDKPLLKFERLLETYMSYAPHGFRSFVAAMPVWLKEKLYLKSVLKKELAQLGGCTPKELPPLLFAEHHQSHAASAFFSAHSSTRPFSASMVSANGRRRRRGGVMAQASSRSGRSIFPTHWGCSTPLLPTSQASR